MGVATERSGLEACTLEVSGVRFPTSTPAEGDSARTVGTFEGRQATVSLGVTLEQARRLVSQVGKTGRLDDSRGRRLGQYRIQRVDAELGVLTAVWVS